MGHFSLKKLINADNIHKGLQDKKFYEHYYVLFDLDVFSFLLAFYTRKYIHCDRKPHIFQLIIKYLRIFKIFIEEIQKYSKFSVFFFNTK